MATHFRLVTGRVLKRSRDRIEFFRKRRNAQWLAKLFADPYRVIKCILIQCEGVSETKVLAMSIDGLREEGTKMREKYGLKITL